MWKAIVSGTADTAHPESRRAEAIDRCAPEETRSNQDGIWATVLWGEPSTSQGTDKESLVNKWKNAAVLYLIDLFPEFQTHYLHFSSPYKKGRFEMECKMVC